MSKKTNYANPVISERIQQVFWKNDLTDGEVSKAIGQERKSVSAYRNCVSNPSIPFVRYLCKTYHIDANWLLDIK